MCNFSFCHNVFPLFVIGYPFNYGDFLFFDKIRSKLSAAEMPYEGKGSRDTMALLFYKSEKLKVVNEKKYEVLLYTRVVKKRMRE